MGFPVDFVWGAATASYQIEGAAREDGRGASIWDVFSHQPGKVNNNENGDVACDHYHHMKEDVKMMSEMGLQAYRFSISWSRLFPDGMKTRNEKGFQFYDDLVNELLKYNIKPVMTLFHWDLPMALYEKGGFLWEGISDAFAYYAGEVAAHFSDRVEMFATMNEPQCVARLGYVEGVHAPGYKWDEMRIAPIMRNLLLSHGKAVIEMRKRAVRDIQIGTVSTGFLCSPIDDSRASLEKARELSFPVDGEGIGFTHTWFLDPVVLGKNDVLMMTLNEEELKIINQPLEFIGINVYNGQQCDEKGLVPRYQGFPRQALGWPVTPEVMHYGMKFLYERYKLPIYITENGLATNDRIYTDGKVHDIERIDFCRTYLTELGKAIDEGADIRGYFHWSLMDNFEWYSGYDPRFGMIFIDFRDQRRIWKDSAYWYKQVIQSNSVV